MFLTYRFQKKDFFLIQSLVKVLNKLKYECIIQLILLAYLKGQNKSLKILVSFRRPSKAHPMQLR